MPWNPNQRTSHRAYELNMLPLTVLYKSSYLITCVLAHICVCVVGSGGGSASQSKQFVVWCTAVCVEQCISETGAVRPISARSVVVCAHVNLLNACCALPVRTMSTGVAASKSVAVCSSVEQLQFWMMVRQNCCAYPDWNAPVFAVHVVRLMTLLCKLPYSLCYNSSCSSSDNDSEPIEYNAQR